MGKIIGYELRSTFLGHNFFDFCELKDAKQKQPDK